MNIDTIRFGEILAKARTENGLSRREMAIKLSKSEKTIENYENGMSVPDFVVTMNWFKACSVPPMPYIYEFLDMGRSVKDDDLKGQMVDRIEQCSREELEMLLFLSSGKHGSSPFSVLNMIIADMQCQISDRVGVAAIIAHNYHMRSARGELCCPDEVQPNMELLERAINAGEEAAIKNNKGYVNI